MNYLRFYFGQLLKFFLKIIVKKFAQLKYL